MTTSIPYSNQFNDIWLCCYDCDLGVRASNAPVLINAENLNDALQAFLNILIHQEGLENVDPALCSVYSLAYLMEQGWHASRPRLTIERANVTNRLVKIGKDRDVFDTQIEPAEFVQPEPEEMSVEITGEEESVVLEPSAPPPPLPSRENIENAIAEANTTASRLSQTTLMINQGRARKSNKPQ